MNMVTTFFFATLRDSVGVKFVQMEIQNQTKVAEFKTILIETYPALAGLMSHTLVSINHEYVFDEAVIPNNAEIALFPPVSGG